MNSEISNLDDFFRPIKSYFYWERHCFDVPMCWAFRSVFDTLDHIDKLAEDINDRQTSLEAIDRVLPQIIIQLKLTADDTEALAALLSTPTVRCSAVHADGADIRRPVNVGLDFDAARSDDFFYIPREGFDNEDVKTGMKLLMSPDGKAARFIVTHEGDAMGPEGVEHVDTVPRSDNHDPERNFVGRRTSLYRRLGVQPTRTSRNTRCPICLSWRSPPSC